METSKRRMTKAEMARRIMRRLASRDDPAGFSPHHTASYRTLLRKSWADLSKLHDHAMRVTREG